VTFSGFGQAVVGTTLSNNKTYPFAPYDADPSFKPESNFALQASAPLTDSITAVAQVLALGQDDFQPKFQWAYIKFQLNNTFALKVGRIEAPLYKYSDFLYVGEAYPWVTPPASVYTTSPFTGADGIELTADSTVGDWDFYTQLVYDNTPTVLVTNNPNGLANAQFTNAFTIAEDATYDNWLSLRAELVLGRLSSALTCDGSITNPVAAATAAATAAAAAGGDQTAQAAAANAAALNAYGFNANSFASCTSNYLVNSLTAQGYTMAAKNLKASNDMTAFWTAGFQVDRWNWTVIGEYVGQGNRESYVSNFQTGYLTVGRHFGRLFPYLTYGHYHAWMHDRASDNVPASAVDQFLPPIAGGLTFQDEIAAIRGSAAENSQDNYYSLGMRYDLRNNVALKFEWTHYHSGYTTPTDPAVQSAINYATYLGVAAGESAGAAATAAEAPFTKNPDSNRFSAAITFAF
jgi:hypothetical protein